METAAGYSDFEPIGQLSFVHDVPDDAEDSTSLFSSALEFRRILGGVVRPLGVGIWLDSAIDIDGTSLTVRDPEPSSSHWQVVARDSVAAGLPPHVVVPDAVVRVVDELSDPIPRVVG